MIRARIRLNPDGSDLGSFEDQRRNWVIRPRIHSCSLRSEGSSDHLLRRIRTLLDPRDAINYPSSDLFADIADPMLCFFSLTSHLSDLAFKRCEVTDHAFHKCEVWFSFNFFFGFRWSKIQGDFAFSKCELTELAFAECEDPLDGIPYSKCPICRIFLKCIIIFLKKSIFFCVEKDKT